MTRPIERATLTVLGTRERTIPVHFNPESLKYRINSTLRPGHGNRTKQHVARSTGSLAMELIFDTTHNGDDVRALTSQIANLVDVHEENGGRQAPVVRFDWGSYSFKGMVESYDETIDFFAASGVPLRARVSLSFAQQDVVFNEPTLPAADSGAGSEPIVALQAGVGVGVGVSGGVGVSVGGVAGASAQMGDPRAARSIGAANGQENLRFGAGASLTIDSGVSLGGPVAFASGGAGAGVSAGVGAGAGLSAGVSVSGGIGGQGSAGVSSSQGAFAGLRASAGVQAGASLDIGALLPSTPSASLGADPCSSFGVGGQTGFQGSASLRADVGASASLRARIQFDAG